MRSDLLLKVLTLAALPVYLYAQEGEYKAASLGTTKPSRPAQREFQLNLSRYSSPSKRGWQLNQYLAGQGGEKRGTVKALSFRGKPKPECNSFLITEFGYSYRLGRNSGDPYNSSRDNFYFTWDLGWMTNLSKSYALGATFYAGADQDGARLGIKPRLRRWLGRDLSLDVSPGILLYRLGGNYDKYPGFTGHVGLNYADWITLIGQVEVIPYEYQGYGSYPNWSTRRGNEVTWYGGVKLGSYPGTVAGILAIAAYAIVSSVTFELNLFSN